MVTSNLVLSMGARVLATATTAAVSFLDNDWSQSFMIALTAG
jgi:hypothetical protein